MNLIIIIVLVLLMAVFTFFDLNISTALFNSNSVFGDIFKNVGEIPAYLIAPLFFACLFYRFKKLRPLVIIILPLSNYFWIRNILLFFNLNTIAFYIILSILMIISSIVLLISFKKIQPITINKLFKILSVCAVFAAVNNLLVQLIKLLWGRVRFFDLKNNFTYWFKPNGPNGNKSFPSGHTTAACALFTVILFCRQFKIKNWKKTLIYISSFIFIICTAVSRIILGAHYATDVTFAALFSYSLFLLIVYTARKKPFHLEL